MAGMSSAEPRSIVVWFRLDLRLADNPALEAALQTGLPIVPVFLWSPEEEQPFAPGAASRWWLHHALLRLDGSLRTIGSRLIIRRGPAADSLLDIAQSCGARRIVRNRVYEPASLAREPHLETSLREHGISVENFNGSLLFDPGSVRNTSDGAFRVFTPFWHAVWNRRGEIRQPPPAPNAIPAPATWPHSLDIRELDLEPKIDWAGGLRAAWDPGEHSARERLHAFACAGVQAYERERDRTDHDGTSRLSPHLHFGEISAAEVWHTLVGSPGAEPYLRQLAWREFAYHLLFERPDTLTEPFNPQFRNFPWRRNQRRLRAWQKGQSGYPMVDAAMRQLWATGWMHNRARLIAASFLVKHLLISWQDGATWFLDTLVDADLANNNTMGWQWVAGCGVDAAPYFRIFNPVLQGEKFDPDGDYIRRWVPELAALPTRFIHQPWNAPALTLTSAGVRLGENYPRPIVDHAEARQAALSAFEEMKRAAARAKA